MANECTLAALVDCTDADLTITNMIEQRGIITDFVYAGIRSTSPLIRLLERTKKEFPSGMGDTLTRGILEVTSPNELDGLNWNPVQSSYPGNSPCCNVYRDFVYGSRTVTGCLSQIGYKSPAFCKVDIVMKKNFLEQLLQIVMTMRNISTGVWDAWLKNSYPRSVTNIVLSKDWKHPEAHGTYPSAARPTTFFNTEHLDIISERTQSVGGLIGSPIRDYQTYIVGRNTFIRMKRRAIEKAATLYGQRQAADFAIPNYAEFSVSDLGKVIVFSHYAFILIDKPRRFREKTGSETWEDAIIPSTVNVTTDRGSKTDRNPDYYNPTIALYEESLLLNLEAVDWLVPPAALAGPISAGGQQFFPALNYAGDFEAVYCPEDPKRKTVRFMADFMGGMMSLFPQKGRAILHLATHIEACDDDDAVCVAGGPTDNSGGNYIRDVAINATAGQLQLLIEGDLPEGCPPGKSLFIESSDGNRYLIGSVVTTWAHAGNHAFPVAGNYVVVQLGAGLNDAAITRIDTCDPWKRIVCLGSDTPSSDPSITPCGRCDNGSTTPDTTCILTAILTSDRIRTVQQADGTDIIAVTNYTVAATLEEAIQDWLDLNGGGTVTVTGGTVAEGFEWTIIVTGNGNLTGGNVMYDDGFAATAEADFVASGTCVAS